MNLRQLATFVGIYEEGSFNKAARRLNATQSGLSVQIRNLEEDLGSALFERSARGVEPTLAGRRLYTAALDILRQIDGIETDLRHLRGEVAGSLRIGLMPTFTRGVVGPALNRFLSAHPNVQVSVVEAYSAALMDMVVASEVDFAIVPRSPDRHGLRTTALGTDREILVRRSGGAIPHMTPVRLQDLGPLRLVLPSRGNARRDALEASFAATGVQIDAIVDMDAMLATLDLVEHSDFVTILPSTICTQDIGGTLRALHPIIGPELTVSYTIIEPARRAPSQAAALMLEELRREYERSVELWEGLTRGAPKPKAKPRR